MTIVAGIVAFIGGIILASVVSAAQIGRSEGRARFEIGELRQAVKALHELVTNLNSRVQMMEADLPK
jgi:CHASE3 domain sensor protein